MTNCKMSGTDRSNDKPQSKGLWQPPSAAKEPSSDQRPFIAGMMQMLFSAIGSMSNLDIRTRRTVEWQDSATRF
jgi:hypothetical protein